VRLNHVACLIVHARITASCDRLKNFAQSDASSRLVYQRRANGSASEMRSKPRWSIPERTREKSRKWSGGRNAQETPKPSGATRRASPETHASHRIEMHVAAQAQQIIALLHQETLVTTLKQMTTRPMPPVKINRVGNQQPMHPASQIWPVGLRGQMKMVPH